MAERDLDALIDEITVDCYNEDECYSAFRQVFEDDVELPTSATHAGLSVTLQSVDYDSNDRRGLVARIERDGKRFDVSFADVKPTTDPAKRFARAYRRWLGVSG